MSQGFDCPVGCSGLWSTAAYRDEHIRRCHPERLKCEAVPTATHTASSQLELIGLWQ